MSDIKNREKKKITVRQIAAAAGVSPATVSRVINKGSAPVAEKTVRHVIDAMEKLGIEKLPEYNPNPASRHVIIMNMPDYNPFYSKVVQGAVASANAHDCHLITSYSPLDRRSCDSFLDLIDCVNAAGVIILNQVNESLLFKINNKVPLIQCCEFNPLAGLPYVSIQDHLAARNATQHLLSKGRNKIAFINGPLTFKYARERLSGFLSAMEDAGLTVPRDWIVNLPEINYEMAYSAITQILSREKKPNAFFTTSDLLAAAVLKAAHAHHYRVPADIMLIGFDNTDYSTTCTPAITTVNQPMFQEGYTACEMLLQRIQNPKEDIRSIYLTSELIIRETT